MINPPLVRLTVPGAKHVAMIGAVRLKTSSSSVKNGTATAGKGSRHDVPLESPKAAAKQDSMTTAVNEHPKPIPEQAWEAMANLHAVNLLEFVMKRAKTYAASNKYPAKDSKDPIDRILRNFIKDLQKMGLGSYFKAKDIIGQVAELAGLFQYLHGVLKDGVANYNASVEGFQKLLDGRPLGDWVRQNYNSIRTIANSDARSVTEALALVPNRWQESVVQTPVPGRDTVRDGPKDSFIGLARQTLSAQGSAPSALKLGMKAFPKMEGVENPFDIFHILQLDMKTPCSQTDMIAMEQHGETVETSAFALDRPGTLQSTFSLNRITSSKHYDILTLRRGKKDIAILFVRRNRRQALEYTLLYREGPIWDDVHRIRKELRHDDTREKLNVRLIRGDGGTYSMDTVLISHESWSKRTKRDDCIFRSTIRRGRAGLFKSKVTTQKK